MANAKIKGHIVQIREKSCSTITNMQPDKTQTKVVPREVSLIAPPRVPITVPPPKVPATVTPPRMMTHRIPIITKEDPSEDIRQRDTVENNNQHQLKHRYPTRITQLSQDINQVYIAATKATRHQHWIMNIHEQVNATPQIIDNCLKDNEIRHLKTMTQNDYLKKMSNAISDDDTGKELNCHQLSKHPKHQKLWKQSFANKLGILYQVEGGRV